MTIPTLWYRGATLVSGASLFVALVLIVAGCGDDSDDTVVGSSLYVSQAFVAPPPQGQQRILKARLDGGDLRTLIETEVSPEGLEVDPGVAGSPPTLFFVEANLASRISSLISANTDGTDPQVIGEPMTDSVATSIALDLENDRIYWVNSFNQSISRRRLDGTDSPEIVVSDPDGVLGAIAIDPVQERLYWAASESGDIVRSDLNGENQESVISGLTNPVAIAVDPGRRIYFATAPVSQPPTPMIAKADLDGSNISVLAAASEPNDIAVDLPNGHIYWVEPAKGTVERARIDGSSAAGEVVVSGLPSIVRLAIGP